eukprot:COSAG01_NODE_12048_length_1808_cov_1.930369_3_plen_81_part_00
MVRLCLLGKKSLHARRWLALGPIKPMGNRCRMYVCVLVSMGVTDTLTYRSVTKSDFLACWCLSALTTIPQMITPQNFPSG